MDLTELLENQGAFVTYRPLRGEVPFSEYVNVEGAISYEIAPRASLDPHEEAMKAIAFAGEKPVAILIPGRAFDRFGMRHGQGGGWYDRFLAEVPATWLRLGFCYAEQLSEEPLLRNSWDQPVDIVCVAGREDHTLSVFETRARLEAFDTVTP